MTRGGKREGSGAPPKPPEEKAKRVTFALHPLTLAAIKSKADTAGISQARLVSLAVAAYQPPAP